MSNVTIVIPVYNEEGQLADCLRTIARQTVRPYEVIVVDNNSTDRTVAVARRFGFVRVITAKRQGVVHARSRGFNAVKSSIIGRIDADTRLPRDWVATVDALFAASDVDALSGSMQYYDVPFKKIIARIDLAFRSRAARLMADEVFLQGANMAMRTSAWHRVKRSLCNKPGMHEDFDVAIHLSAAGFKVVFDRSLQAAISSRCVNDTCKSFWRYALLNPRTYSQHNLVSGRHMWPIVLLVLLFHVPLRALHRGYDSETDSFSFKNAWSSSYRRINPATFVD